MSCPVSALVAGVKIGTGSRSDSCQPRRQRDPADPTGLPVLLPAGTRQVPAGHALDGHRCRAPHEHGTTTQQARVTGDPSGILLRPCRQHMIRHEVTRAVEPECGQLREHLALVGNRRPKHEIESRDPIGGDDQQRIIDLIQVPNLTATMRRQAFQGGFEDRSGRRHGGTSQATRCQAYKARRVSGKREMMSWQESSCRQD